MLLKDGEEGGKGIGVDASVDSDFFIVICRGGVNENPTGVRGVS
jgi:hypothetical protein